MTVWVWCKSLRTGHRFDIPLQALDRLLATGAVEEIPGRRRRARDARPPKCFVGLDGKRRNPSAPAWPDHT